MSENELRLTVEQTKFLEQHGNTSEDWSRVLFKCPKDMLSVTLKRIKNCAFNGMIYVGSFDSTVKLAEGARLKSGLYNSNFFNLCILSDNCLVQNVTLVSNVSVGQYASLIQCNQVVGLPVDDYCSSLHGLLTSIQIGPESNNEGTTRIIHTSKDITYAQICRQLLHKEEARRGSSVVEEKRLTVIGNRASISNCIRIQNCFIAAGTTVSDSTMTNSTVGIEPSSNAKKDSNNDDDDNDEVASVYRSKVTVSGSTVSHSIIHNHCTVSDRATLQNVLMFSHSSITHGAHVSHTVLASDSSISHAECAHSVVGPFVGFHHTSLLISTNWLLGRGNMGYGAMIGANHTGRSNDQECLLGEGTFVGLSSAVKFPFNSLESPYSIIASATTCLPQRVCMPFSLINNPDGAVVTLPMARTCAVPSGNCGGGAAHILDGLAPPVLSPAVNCIKPGWVLWGSPYFVERSMDKFTKRRESLEYRTDFPIFRPSIVNMVIRARDSLTTLKNRYPTVYHSSAQTANAKEQGVFTEHHLRELGKCFLYPSDVDRAVSAYTGFIQRYALHGLLYLLITGRYNEPDSPVLTDGAAEGAEEAVATDPATDPATAIAATTTAATATTRPYSMHASALEATLRDVEDMESGEFRRPVDRSVERVLEKIQEADMAVSEATAGVESIGFGVDVDDKEEESVSSKTVFSLSPSLSARKLSTLAGLRDTNGRMCLLTDSHIPAVLHHQVHVLLQEFPALLSSLTETHDQMRSADADVVAAFVDEMGRQLAIASKQRDYAGFSVRSSYRQRNQVFCDLLNELSALESSHAAGVRDCKGKDVSRAMTIIPDYQQRVETHLSTKLIENMDVTGVGMLDVLSMDATIAAADTRAKHIAMVVREVIVSYA